MLLALFTFLEHIQNGRQRDTRHNSADSVPTSNDASITRSMPNAKESDNFVLLQFRPMTQSAH